MYTHIYNIYSHIYRHMYNLHIFKFVPSGAKEMSTKSLKQGVKEVRPFDSLEAEELQGSLSTRGGALDLLIQPRPIHELSKVKVTNCLFSSRSRFKAFPSPVISTNIKTCPFRHTQTQQQILKYCSPGITDTKQLVFIFHSEPGNLYYLFLLSSFSFFRMLNTSTLLKHLSTFLGFLL